jgi:hypothetical protein
MNNWRIVLGCLDDLLLLRVPGNKVLLTLHFANNSGDNPVETGDIGP